LYALRWLLSAAALLGIVLSLGLGGKRIGDLGTTVARYGETTNGAGPAPPPVFDPRMQLWFGEEDAAVQSYEAIEDRFVAEDFVLVAFQEKDDPLGVFGPKSLATIARLTDAIQRVPGVRHVRSLTSNPWIRWGEIEAGEEGLMISDLVEEDPADLSSADRIERMVAVLGGEASAALIGEDAVREVVGHDVGLEDFIGEPRLLGTIVSPDARTTVVQVQVLRPVADAELAEKALEGDPQLGAITPDLYSVLAQRAALRGIGHALRVELGRSVETDELRALRAEIDAMEEGDEKAAWLQRISDPTLTFIDGPDGERLRKWFDYDPDGSGGWVDVSEAGAPVAAPDGFAPAALSDYDFRLGGTPLFELNFEEVGMADAKYMGVMFAIIIVLLFVVFRSVAGVVAPMAVVFGSVGAMVGIAFLLGFLFNNLTMISPNMLTAVGIADAIHLVASWMVIRRRADSKHSAILETMRRNAVPVLLTSVTTAIGFFSLTVSGLAPVRMLGIMAGIGALVALVLSLTIVPAVLSLVPHRPGGDARVAGAGLFERGRAERFVAFIVSKRAPILAVTAALALIAVFGVSRVRIDTDFRAMFPDDNEKIADFQWIEDQLGGVGDLEIVFDGTRGETRAPELTRDERARLDGLSVREAASQADGELAVLDGAEAAELERLRAKDAAWSAARIGVDAEFLGALDAFEARLREEMADPESDLAVVTDLISPLDILRKIHQVQNKNAAAFYRAPTEQDVPEDARVAEVEYDEWTEEWSYTPPQAASSLVAQYYLQYENGAKPGENLATQLSQDRTQFRMQGRVLQAPSDVQTAAFTRIEEIARTEFPILGARAVGGDADDAPDASAEMTISGKTLLFARTTRIFAVGFVQSMSIALALITAIIAVLFRSWRLALISVIPNLLPILIPLSVFGLLGQTLDGPAILVSSVALGVCVDDTIHVFTKFMRARRAGLNADDALAHVFEEAGAAVTLTTIVLVIGFSTLLLSDFRPNVLMGSLAGTMIGLAWLADMFVVPLFLRDMARAEDARADAPAAPATAPAVAGA
ncbi:MAG: MMPL family transporter, partial [Planctomycetota bacterium]